jgi:hypothetical protein
LSLAFLLLLLRHITRKPPALYNAPLGWCAGRSPGHCRPVATMCGTAQRQAYPTISSSVSLKSIDSGFEKRHHRSYNALQQRTLRPRPGQHPYTEMHAQQQPGEIVGGLCSRNRAGPLTGLHTTQEKRFNLYQYVCDRLLKIGVVWCNLKRGIHQQASLTVPVADRSLDDVPEECLDGIQRW